MKNFCSYITYILHLRKILFYPWLSKITIRVYRTNVQTTISILNMIKKISHLLQDTFEDYLEMFIQFGYVVLFSSAFPLAGLFALLNNVVEIRSDAFKLCTNLQRPFGVRMENIGTWQVNTLEKGFFLEYSSQKNSVRHSFRHFSWLVYIPWHSAHTGCTMLGFKKEWLKRNWLDCSVNLKH